MRQEIEGPQAEQNLYNSRMIEEAGIDQIKDHIFLILKVKETTLTIHVLLGGQKRVGEEGGATS